MTSTSIINIDLDSSVSVGEFCYLGRGNSAKDTVIGKNGSIGSYVIIEKGVTIGNNFSIDDRCTVYNNARVGNGLILCYGKNIHANAIVGDDCIIGGHVCERMIIGNRVTFMGEVAHSHYNPKADWNTTDEPSPIIGDGSIIGVNALIIGGVSIGSNCYVSAGEILRTNLPDNSVFLKDNIYPIESFRGLFTTRY